MDRNERVVKAREAITQLFALNAHARNDESRAALNAAMDELELAVLEADDGE